jgi:hypothetical protein
MAKIFHFPGCAMRNGILVGLLFLSAAAPAPAQAPAPNWGYRYQGPYPAPGYGWYGPPPQPYYYPQLPAYPYPPQVPYPQLPVAPVVARPAAAPAGRPTSLPDPKVTQAQAPAETPPAETAEGGAEPDGTPLALDVPGTEPGAAAAPAVLSGADFHRPHQERWWLAGGYTAAWIRSAQIPIPLLTTGSANDSPPGALGQPGTAVLFGNNSVNFGTFHGGWAELGFWLDTENRWSLDFGGFALAPSHVQYSVSSDATGNPAITRPIFGLIGGSEAAFVDALPNTAAGGSLIDVRSLMLGGEVNTRYYVYCCRRLRADALIGFRTLHYEEGLDIQDRIQPLAANSFTYLGNVVNPPNTLADLDHFKTINTFYGAQFGGRLRWEHELCFVDVFGKVGVGVNSQIANIYGVSNLIAPNGAASAAPGGVLALPTNIGEHSRHQVGYTREAGFNIGFDPHQHIRFKVGYSFLSWSGVVRTGDTLDRVVNPRQVPTDQAFGQAGGAARPAFIFTDELLWVQFLNVGMEFHW